MCKYFNIYLPYNKGNDANSLFPVYSYTESRTSIYNFILTMYMYYLNVGWNIELLCTTY